MRIKNPKAQKTKVNVVGATAAATNAGDCLLLDSVTFPAAVALSTTTTPVVEVDTVDMVEDDEVEEEVAVEVELVTDDVEVVLVPVVAVAIVVAVEVDVEVVVAELTTLPPTVVIASVSFKGLSAVSVLHFNEKYQINM